MSDPATQIPTTPTSVPTHPTTIPTIPTRPTQSEGFIVRDPAIPIPTIPTSIPTNPETIPTIPTILPTEMTLPATPTRSPTNLSPTVPSSPTSTVPSPTTPDEPIRRRSTRERRQALTYSCSPADCFTAATQTELAAARRSLPSPTLAQTTSPDGAVDPQMTADECADSIFDPNLSEGLIGSRVRCNVRGDGTFDGTVIATSVATDDPNRLLVHTVRWDDEIEGMLTFCEVLMAATAPPGTAPTLVELQRRPVLPATVPPAAHLSTTRQEYVALPVPESFQRYPLRVSYEGRSRSACFLAHESNSAEEMVWKVQLTDGPPDEEPVTLSYDAVELELTLEHNKLRNKVRCPASKIPTIPLNTFDADTAVAAGVDAHGGRWTKDCPTVGVLVSVRPGSVAAPALLGAPQHGRPRRASSKNAPETFQVYAAYYKSNASFPCQFLARTIRGNSSTGVFLLTQAELSEAAHGITAANLARGRRRGRGRRLVAPPTRTGADNETTDEATVAFSALYQTRIGSDDFVATLRSMGAALPSNVADLVGRNYLMHGARVPNNALALYRRIMEAAANAVQANHEDEDLWRAFLLLDCCSIGS